jgi:hypothetical protein
MTCAGLGVPVSHWKSYCIVPLHYDRYGQLNVTCMSPKPCPSLQHMVLLLRAALLHIVVQSELVPDRQLL